MTDLLTRLEAAEEGSRELDAEIEIAVLPAYMVTKDAEGFVQINMHGTALTPVWADYNPHSAPHYTTSIDAALTLIPDGWRYWHYWTGVYGAAVFPTRGGGPRIKVHDAATPALALCIAALKAREVEDD